MTIKPPLPASPLDPAFRAACQRAQLDYIAAERWRYGRAMAFPAWRRGLILSDRDRAWWAALNLHPQTREELQARLDQLDGMEAETLTDAGWLAFTADMGAMLHNRPAQC